MRKSWRRAVAVVAGAAVIAGATVSILSLSSGASRFREQPDLVEIERGEEWRLLIADDGIGMPQPREGVLAVRIGRGPVDVLDGDGRIAMRIETAGTPMAVINDHERLILVTDQDRHGAWTRLLVIGMEKPGVLLEIPLEGRRVGYSIFYGRGIEASTDGRWAYWLEHDWTGERWEYSIRAVSLDSGLPADWHLRLPTDCGWPGLESYEGSAIVARCNETALLVDVMDEARILTEPAGDARTEDQYVLELDWARDLESVALRMVDRASGNLATEKELSRIADARLLDSRQVLVLRLDGTLERMDIWTGDKEALPYRLKPISQAGDVALTR